METGVNYFTKEITISPTQEGSCILDLFQHFAPYESNKHQAWQIACHAACVQSAKTNRVEQHVTLEGGKKDKTGLGGRHASSDVLQPFFLFTQECARRNKERILSSSSFTYGRTA